MSTDEKKALKKSHEFCDLLLDKVYEIPVKIKNDLEFLKAVSWLESVRDGLHNQILMNDPVSEV